MVSEVDGGTAEGQLGVNASAALAEHRIEGVSENVCGGVGGVNRVLQKGISLQGDGVCELGVHKVAQDVLAYRGVLIFAGTEHDARQEH